MYPTSIIVLVSLQQTFVETTMVNTREQPEAPLSRILFAHSAQEGTSTFPRTLDTTSTQVEMRKRRTEGSTQDDDMKTTNAINESLEGNSTIKEV